jgi:hypothetical protein
MPLRFVGSSNRFWNIFWKSTNLSVSTCTIHNEKMKMRKEKVKWAENETRKKKWVKKNRKKRKKKSSEKKKRKKEAKKRSEKKKRKEEAKRRSEKEEAKRRSEKEGERRKGKIRKKNGRAPWQSFVFSKRPFLFWELFVGHMLSIFLFLMSHLPKTISPLPFLG